MTSTGSNVRVQWRVCERTTVILKASNEPVTTYATNDQSRYVDTLFVCLFVFFLGGGGGGGGVFSKLSDWSDILLGLCTKYNCPC